MYNEEIMDDEACFDAVCGLVPPVGRVSVNSGYVRHGSVLGGETVYQYVIHASDVFGLSTKSYQDAFDVWKSQVDCGRSRKIESLKSQLSEFEGAEVEA